MFFACDFKPIDPRNNRMNETRHSGRCVKYECRKGRAYWQKPIAIIVSHQGLEIASRGISFHMTPSSPPEHPDLMENTQRRPETVASKPLQKDHIA